MKKQVPLNAYDIVIQPNGHYSLSSVNPKDVYLVTDKNEQQQIPNERLMKTILLLQKYKILQKPAYLVQHIRNQLPLAYEILQKSHLEVYPIKSLCSNLQTSCKKPHTSSNTRQRICRVSRAKHAVCCIQRKEYWRNFQFK